MKVKDVLAIKSPEVFTIQGDRTVYEAVKLLVKHNIGALLVRNEAQEIVGILTERDILRQVSQQCEALKKTPVKEVMSTNLIIAGLEDDLDYVEQVMIKNRIRHLPVISQDKLEGIFSIRDVVKAQIKDVAVENRYLRDYIEGKYPA